MKWETWRPQYEWIAERLKLNIRFDEKAATEMEKLLPEPNLSKLEKIIRGKDCVVFGAGPSLDANLEKLKQSGYLNKVLITADGATSAVLKYKNPEIIVTDLDGAVDDQLKAWQLGSWMVVHAHGDNVAQVRKIVPLLKERVIGTTQVKPFGKLYNFGGFTDGDRAAFLAHELGASKIYLAGMDLGTKIGKYSGKKNTKRKLIKLKICGEMLSWIARGLGAPIVDLTKNNQRRKKLNSEPCQ
jgi:hypothetical protein